jgi:hypothetical protein
MGSYFGAARSTGVLGAKLLGSVSCCMGLVGSDILASLEVTERKETSVLSGQVGIISGSDQS